MVPVCRRGAKPPSAPTPTWLTSLRCQTGVGASTGTTTSMATSCGFVNPFARNEFFTLPSPERASLNFRFLVRDAFPHAMHFYFKKVRKADGLLWNRAWEKSGIPKPELDAI